MIWLVRALHWSPRCGCSPAQVLLDGKVVAALERSCPRQVQLPKVLVFFSQVTVLEVVVHAMGRRSGGCEWDVKGLVYPNIQLNGTLPHVHSHYSRSRTTTCYPDSCKMQCATLSGCRTVERAPTRRVRRIS